MDTSSLSVQAVDPRSLSDGDIADIHEVIQDVWAEGIGEYVQCTRCHRVSSKKDIHGHLPYRVYARTVRQILGDHEDTAIKSPCCHASVKYIYGHQYRRQLREKLMNTSKSFLVLVRKKAGDIVGFETAYVDTLEKIFHREYALHYGDIGYSRFSQRVGEALGEDHQDFVAISDIGIRPSYQSFHLTFQILHHISRAMSRDYDALPGCTEVHEGDGLHRVSLAMGSRSLGFGKDPLLAKKITNTSPHYQSDIHVLPRVTEGYRKFFSGNSRDLMRLMRGATSV